MVTWVALLALGHAMAPLAALPPLTSPSPRVSLLPSLTMIAPPSPSRRRGEGRGGKRKAGRGRVSSTRRGESRVWFEQRSSGASSRKRSPRASRWEREADGLHDTPSIDPSIAFRGLQGEEIEASASRMLAALHPSARSERVPPPPHLPPAPPSPLLPPPLRCGAHAQSVLS